MAGTRFTDRIAIITGAARGLGEALCYGFAEQGARVCPWDVNAEALAAVSAKLDREYKLLGRAAVVDITREQQVADEVERIRGQFGHIDILVANAGVLESFEITEFPEAAWRKVIEINLTGYFICAKYAARVMKQQRSGAIIQINSKSGKKGSLWNSAYVASKFGGIGLTQSIALDLARYGVRVNAVCPGNLLDSPLWQTSLFEQYAKKWGITVEEVRKKYTEQVPLGRPCTYRDVVNAAVFLAGDDADYMTGQALNVTGGQEMR
jgi:sorbitol-6-phosphate 2-dehydrogenase